jgi:hypothetical protein
MFPDRVRFHALITTFVLIAYGCSRPHAAPQPSPMSAGAQTIPTRYDADRFLATAVTQRGDTAVFFLDTGSGTYVWDVFLPWFDLKPDSIVNARGGKSAVVPFPSLRVARSSPMAGTRSTLGNRLQVYPIDYHAQNNFGAWIIRTTQAQLGYQWFGDRIWTFDYPAKRLLFHPTAPPISPNARQVRLDFAIDSTGRRLSQQANLDIVVDGDSLSMIFDTGATIWLSQDALTRVADGGRSERSSSHIFRWVFERLHQRHPDWPVIEKADLWMGLALIRVPSVTVAGYELGPTWFSVLDGPTTPPTVPASEPAWRRRRGGTIGGSLLRNFVVTADWPRGIAWFVRP